MGLKHIASASLIVLVLASVGCKPKDDSVDCNFDESAMLTNFAENLIIPAFGDLKAALTTLKVSIEAFNADPNIATLGVARSDFEDAFIAYQSCSMFSMGPGTDAGTSFRERVNTYPTTISTLESNISNGATDIATNGRATVGLPAIAFLLYDEPGTSDTDVLNNYTSQDGQLRKDYLIALVNRLEDLISDIESSWNTSYRSQFISNTGTSEGSSIALLINDLSYDFEIRKNFGFKIPLGKFNGGIALPEQCEGYHAQISAELSLAHVSALKNVFKGGTGQGLDDYLKCLEHPYNEGLLETAMNDQFQTIEADVVAVPDPMSETLTSNYQVVDDAYSSLSAMVPLLKREMPAALGVSITYQDADGD